MPKRKVLPVLKATATATAPPPPDDDDDFAVDDVQHKKKRTSEDRREIESWRESTEANKEEDSSSTEVMSLLRYEHMRPYNSWPPAIRNIYSKRHWISRADIHTMMVFFFVNDLKWNKVYSYIITRGRIPHKDELMFAHDLYIKMQEKIVIPLKPFLSFHVASQRYQYIDGCDYYDSACYGVDKYIENRFGDVPAKMMAYGRYGHRVTKTRVVRHPDQEGDVPFELFYVKGQKTDDDDVKSKKEEGSADDDDDDDDVRYVLTYGSYANDIELDREHNCKFHFARTSLL